MPISHDWIILLKASTLKPSRDSKHPSTSMKWSWEEAGFDPAHIYTTIVTSAAVWVSVTISAHDEEGSVGSTSISCHWNSSQLMHSTTACTLYMHVHVHKYYFYYPESHDSGYFHHSCYQVTSTDQGGKLNVTSKKPWKERVGKAMCVYEYTDWIYIRGLLWPPLMCAEVYFFHVTFLSFSIIKMTVRRVFERWMFESGELLLRLISGEGESALLHGPKLRFITADAKQFMKYRGYKQLSAASRTGWDDCDWRCGKNSFFIPELCSESI